MHEVAPCEHSVSKISRKYSKFHNLQLLCTTYTLTSMYNIHLYDNRNYFKVTSHYNDRINVMCVIERRVKSLGSTCINVSLFTLSVKYIQIIFYHFSQRGELAKVL